MSRSIRIAASRVSKDQLSVEFDLSIGDEIRTLWFRSQRTPLTPTLESAAAACVWPCMRLGRDFDVGGPISARFVEAMATLQDIYKAWIPAVSYYLFDNWSPPPAEKRRSDRVGCFFSGGVDSFHTLLKNQHEITDLVFVHGLDIRLNDHALRERTSAAIHAIASELGKNVIELETNVESLLRPYIPYAIGYGAALAAIGHVLTEQLGKIYVASQHPYAELRPCGSHPLTDPLWSSDLLEFCHDGAEASRVQKVERIAQHDVALRHLRVCWETDGAYNCGHCEKCLRTMINLAAVGALSCCETFVSQLDPHDVRLIVPRSETERSYLRENLRELRTRRSNPALISALSWALAPDNLKHKAVNAVYTLQQNPARFRRTAIRSLQRLSGRGSSRLPAARIVELLRQAEVRRDAGESPSQICAALGISEQEYAKWRNKFKFGGD